MIHVLKPIYLCKYEANIKLLFFTILALQLCGTLKRLFLMKSSSHEDKRKVSPNVFCNFLAFSSAIKKEKTFDAWWPETILSYKSKWRRQAGDQLF
jgi:hypothetical protein